MCTFFAEITKRSSGLEDLAVMGFTAADLAPQGKAFSKWDDVSKGLLERGLKSMKISR